MYEIVSGKMKLWEAAILISEGTQSKLGHLSLFLVICVAFALQ